MPREFVCFFSMRRPIESSLPRRRRAYSGPTMALKGLRRGSAVKPRGGLIAKLLHRVEKRLRAVDDRVVDHLAVELDRRGAAGLGFFEGDDDAPGLGQLFLGRQVGRVYGRDLVRVDAQAALEAAAAAALERPREGRGFLEMEPGAVERI